MISAPPTYNVERDYGPLAGLGGLLSGKGDGFLTQLANAFNAAQGGDGKGGLIGLFMQGRKNRDSAKLAYDKDVGENLKQTNGIINAANQYLNPDGTYDVDSMMKNPEVRGLFANYGLYNLNNDTVTDTVKNAHSYNDKFGEHAQLGYAQDHTWDEYKQNKYEAFNPRTFYGDTEQGTQAQPTAASATGTGIADTVGGTTQPTATPTATMQAQTNNNTWHVADTGSSTPDASQLMAQATQVDQANLPTRDSALSKQSQEEGQKATQEAVNKGMEAANKGPGLLGSALKGAIIGLATGGSGWVGALNGAKNWGLGQLGSVGQLYGAYQGISDATKGTPTVDTTSTQQVAQAPAGNWQQFSLTQPTGYQMGNYGSSFMRNNGYGGLF